MRERILIAAGGTGGHLFPAEALSAALVARGHDTALITDRRTAARAGETFETVHVVASGGIVGKGVSARARGAAAIAAGTIAARRIVKREHPAVVVGFGGYPSVPPVLAARLLPFRPRIVLHDQNAVLGGANRLLARFADAVATSFDTVEGVPPGTRRVATGNPVRPAIAAIGPWQPPGERLEILVLGGSLRARACSATSCRPHSHSSAAPSACRSRPARRMSTASAPPTPPPGSKPRSRLSSPTWPTASHARSS